jgi:N-ethylmaleimide reductase
VALERLLSPYDLGSIRLKNRVVMAPMTRNRAIGHTPNALMATYYQQRAGAGLIITEGTSPSADGLGYARIPGLYTAQDVEGWRETTQAVHAQGAKIFVQLMHTGRASIALNMPPDTRIVAPSAIALEGTMHTDQEGPKPYPVPHALSASEIPEVIEAYAKSAELAMQAGFDGIELHGANGYLIDQFFNCASNQRQDEWGGSVQGRIRFGVEVAKACVARIGAERVGFRISPNGVFNGMISDPEMGAVFQAFASAANDLKLAYIHVVDHSSMGAPAPEPATVAAIRAAFKGTYILSGGYDAQRAEEALAANLGELVAFGRPFISNPNLVEKMAQGRSLRDPDFATFYLPGPKGYTDYPID